LKEGELKAVDYEEEKVHYCEIEQGTILGEEEDEGIDEIQGIHNFKTNKFSVNVGIEDGESPHECILKDIPSNGVERKVFF